MTHEETLRPAISASEFASRRKRVAEVLADHGIDAWVAYGDDREVAGPDNVRYLSNLQPHFEPVLLAGGPARDFVMITGPETLDYARVAAVDVAEIVPVQELDHPAEEYPTIQLSRGVEVLREVTQGAQRIGLLGFERIPQPLYSALFEGVWKPEADLVPADDLVYCLRGIKSAAEQAVIDEAYRIARAGLLAAVEALRPGVTERGVAAEAESAMRQAGAEGFGIDTMVASGVANTRPILARSTFRRIGADDLVTITLAPRYEGYHAALGRPFLFRPNRQVEHAVEIARAAQRAAEARLRVGLEGREAELASREIVARGNTGAEYPYVGVHSIGIIEFEPPIFASSSVQKIKEGMALSIDVPLFHAAWGGLRLEDGFAIENGRARPRIDNYQTLVPLSL